MFKNESISIKPLQNGYKISYEYRKMNDNKSEDSYRNWDYIDEEYMYATWDEVVAFVSQHKLEVPPAKI